MSKLTAQVLFYQEQALIEQLADIRSQLRTERRQYYSKNRQAMPSMEQFRKEIGL